jgi:hypothetical protein
MLRYDAVSFIHVLAAAQRDGRRLDPGLARGAGDTRFRC